MMEVLALSHRWPGAQSPCLEGIGFQAHPGDIICLAGCNGSGKSTLLQLVAGILQPEQGQIRIVPEQNTANSAKHSPCTAPLSASGCPDASSGSDSRPAASSKAAPPGNKRNTALLLQDADMQILGSTVAEDMLLHWPRPEAQRIAAAHELAQRLGLAHAWDASVHTLSYGQKRKLCLASALLTQPSCLLLDEPFSGLDYPGMLELRGILTANRALGLIQIVSTHDLEPLIDLASHMLVLHQGQQAFYGSPEDGLRQLEHKPEWGLRPPCSWQRGHGIEPWIIAPDSPARMSTEPNPSGTKNSGSGSPNPDLPKTDAPQPDFTAAETSGTI